MLRSRNLRTGHCTSYRTFPELRENECQACGCAPDTVHHQDFDWTNQSFSNAMTLCKKCHQRVHSAMFPNSGWNNLDPYNNIGRKQSEEEKQKRIETHRNKHPLNINFIKFCKQQGLTIKQTAKIIGWTYEGLGRRLKKEGTVWSKL